MVTEKDIIEEEWLEFIKNIKDNTFLGISTLHQAKLEKYFKLILTKALQSQKQRIIKEIEKHRNQLIDENLDHEHCENCVICAIIDYLEELLKW